MASNITSSIHTARRKVTQCHCCGLNIKIGQQYEVTMVGDGSEVWFHKAHVECNELATAMHDYFQMNNDEGFTQTEFLEGLNELCRDYGVDPHPDTKPELILAAQQILKLGIYDESL